MFKFLFFQLLFFVSVSITYSQSDTVKTVKKQGNKLAFYCKYEINYPAEAKEKKIEGEVMLSFDVDAMCVFSNKKVVKGLGHGLDEEALRILDEYEKCFKSANANMCDPVEGFMMPVKFKLPVPKK